jgi:hypothetical protein
MVAVNLTGKTHSVFDVDNYPRFPAIFTKRGLDGTMSNTMTSVDDFSIDEFSWNGISHRIYRKGAGPDVLLMHELPGMTPQFIGLA